MPEPRFRELSRDLIRGGIPAHRVCRIISELKDHHADLEQEALAAGYSPEEAAADARARLGDEKGIATDVLARPELKSWAHRWPWAAALLKPMMVMLLLPVIPVIACAENGEAIARWGTAFSFGVFVTVAFLFVLQLVVLAA
jgi:hypothetical protein